MQMSRQIRPLERERTALAPGWVLVSILAAVGLMGIWQTLPGAASRNDFAHYYLSAKILLSGGDPYLVPLEPLCEEYGFEYDRRIPYGANPPLLIRMFSAIAWMPPTAAYGAWLGLQFGLLALLLEATRRILGWRANDVRWWLIVSLVLCSTSLRIHFYYSQVQVLVGAAIAWAYFARLRKRHLLACGLVALAAGFKLYPAVLLPWFVLAGVKDIREPLRRSLVVATGLGLALAATGPAAWISFIENGLPVIHHEGSVVSYTNYSLQAVLVNGLGGLLSQWLPENAAHVAGAVARAVALGTITAAYLYVWLRKPGERAGFCLLIITMIACSPVAWAHYMVLMILPAALLIQAAQNLRDERLRWTAYATAWLVLMPDLDAPLLREFRHSAEVLTWIVHYYPLYLLALAAYLVVQIPKRAAMIGAERLPVLPAGREHPAIG